MTAIVLDSAPAEINLGVFTLRDDVSELRPLQPLAAADRTQIRRGVETLASFGEGSLVDCFQRIGERLDPTSSPLVVMVTDGQELNAEAANLAAGKLLDDFEGRMKFVLVRTCKHGVVADRLQTLAASAGGDSISLTSENDIPTGLASVREACDEVRRHRKLMVEQLKDECRQAKHALVDVREQLRLSSHSNKELTEKFQSLKESEEACQKEVSAKDIKIATQSGQINELKEQALFLGVDLSATLVSLGDEKELRIQAEAELEELAKDQAELEKLRGKIVVSQEEIDQLNTYRNSWIAPFVDWSATVGGLLGALFLLGGPGASMITTKLLGGRLGMAIGEGEEKVARSMAEVTKTVTESVSQKLAEQQKDAIAELKSTEQLLEKRVTELASQQTETTVQKIEETKCLQQDAGRKLEEIGSSANGQFGRVTEVVSLAISNVGDQLIRTEEKLLAGQTQILGCESAAHAEQQNVANLQAAIVGQATAQAALIKENAAAVNGQLQDSARTSAERFEATRVVVEAGKAEVANAREALQREIEETSDETIRRISEKSDGQLATLSETVRETRGAVERHVELTQASAEATRDSVNRIGQQVEQLPTQLEAAGSQVATAATQEMRQQVTSVQIILQSVRDQIDQLKHQVESGLHDSEQRQIENSGQTERLGNELTRLSSLSDDIASSVQSETAKVTSEVKDVTHDLSGSLTRVESQLQSVIRDLDSLRASRSDNSAIVGELKCQLSQLQNAISNLPGKAGCQASSPEVKLDSVYPAEAEVRPEEEPTENPERQVKEPVQQEKEIIREVRTDSVSMSDVRRQEIRELSMLPGLGEKSAETLVSEGVNSIHELADLADDRKGSIERRGGQFRRLDEWIAVARKVRTLHEAYDVPLKAAIGYAKSESWPEKLRHLPQEELQQLSNQFRGFGIWLNDSDTPSSEEPSEPEDD